MVATGAVGSRWAGWLRLFRYGLMPHLHRALARLLSREHPHYEVEGDESARASRARRLGRARRS